MKMARPLFSILLITMTAASNIGAQVRSGPPRGETWRALHLIGYETDRDLDELGRNIPQLAGMGVNVLILEVDYNFNFKSHPELRRGESPITTGGARRFAATCRKHGVR